VPPPPLLEEEEEEEEEDMFVNLRVLQKKKMGSNLNFFAFKKGRKKKYSGKRNNHKFSQQKCSKL